MFRAVTRVHPPKHNPVNPIRIGTLKTFNKLRHNNFPHGNALLSRPVHSTSKYHDNKKNQTYTRESFSKQQLDQIYQVSRKSPQQSFGWLLLLLPLGFLFLDNEADAAEPKSSARQAFEQKKLEKKQEERDEVVQFKVIRAVRLMEQGNPQEALEILDELIQENPDQMDFYIMKMAMLFELGAFGDVISSAEDILDLDPKNIAALSYKAYAFTEMGLTDEALDALEDALKVDPENSQLLTAKGRGLLDILRTDEGIDSCERAIHFDKNEHTAHICKGIGMMMKKDFDAAVRSFDSAIKAHPEDPEGYFRKGLALIDQEKFPDAVRYLEQAIQLEPSHFDAWNAKGFAHIQMGQNFEGQRSIAHAKRIIAQIEKEENRMQQAMARQMDTREQQQQFDDDAVFGIKGRRG